MNLEDLREGQPMNEETAAQLESLLRNISYWIKKKGRDALATVRITLPQFQVLQLVYFREAVNVRGLTRLTGLAASTVSEMVDRLVELGYVTKKQNEVDRRQIVLTCTKQGSSIIRKVIRKRIKTVSAIMQEMNPGSAERLVQMLTEFVELSSSVSD